MARDATVASQPEPASTSDGESENDLPTDASDGKSADLELGSESELPSDVGSDANDANDANDATDVTDPLAFMFRKPDATPACATRTLRPTTPLNPS